MSFSMWSRVPPSALGCTAGRASCSHSSFRYTQLCHCTSVHDALSVTLLFAWPCCLLTMVPICRRSWASSWWRRTRCSGSTCWAPSLWGPSSVRSRRTCRHSQRKHIVSDHRRCSSITEDVHCRIYRPCSLTIRQQSSDHTDLGSDSADVGCWAKSQRRRRRPQQPMAKLWRARMMQQLKRSQSLPVASVPSVT